MSRKTAPCEEQLEAIERKLATIIANFGYLKGRSAKTTEVMAYIYIRQEATQQLLRDLTGYSLGTISAALHDLENLGAISKHPNSNSREYVYRLTGTPSQLMSRSMNDFQIYLSKISRFLKAANAKLSKPSFSKKQGYNTLRRFLDEMNILVPAYQHVLQKFQTTPSAVSKQGDTTNDQHH